LAEFGVRERITGLQKLLKLLKSIFLCSKHITAPGYLSGLTVSVGSAARRQLLSASTSDLVVPPTRRASIGDHAYAVAGPRSWNSLYLQLSA